MIRLTRLGLAAGLPALLISCGGNQEAAPTEVVVTDTLVQTKVVEVTPAIDSAAVTALYEAAHAKAKGVHQVKHKAHKKDKTKMVQVDTHTPIEHHEAVQPAVSNTATPAPATTPDPVTVVETVVVHDVQKVYFRPDEKASFPGGEKAFDQFLHDNFEYPEDALKWNREGTIYAVVHLDEQGNVVKVEFPGKRLGSGIEEEAERVLMTSPRWNPAKHEGAAVKSKFTVPLTFDIQ